MQKVFNIQYNIWKKTFKTTQQLSCFVGHPVLQNRKETVYAAKRVKISK